MREIELFDQRATVTLTIEDDEPVAEAAWREIRARAAGGGDPELALLLQQVTPLVDSVLTERRLERTQRPADRDERMSRLAESFPTLEGQPGVRPWDPTRFADQEDQGSGHRAAVQFVLHVWNTANPFDIEAFASWDSAHRAAFVAWAKDPWWA